MAAACALGACGDRATPPGREPQGPPTPTAVDTAALAADTVVAAVLAECHRPLLGGMGRVTATVKLPDGSDVQLFAALPDQMRVQSAAGRFLLRGDSVVRLDAPPEATAEDVRRVQALRTLLDAAAFGPLHRATGCRRLGANTFELSGPHGTTTLELRPGTLLPQSFRWPECTATVLDWLRTPTTWIARELEVAELGRCRVQLEQSRLEWAKDFFVAPGEAKPASGAKQRIPGPGPGAEQRSPTPIVVDSKALRWAIVRDPGDWPGRVAAYRSLHDELEHQNQAIAGFPLLWAENGQRWLAAPFRQRPDGDPLEPPAGWQLREHAAGKWLCVWPADGDLAQKTAAGERLLQDALLAGGHRASGPIVAQPYLHLHEGEPDAKKLAAPVVRLAVRIE